MDHTTSSDAVAARQILLAFYRENAREARSYERQRQSVTGMVALAAALVIGLAPLAPAGAPRLAAAAFLVLLGGFGFLACLRHHERGRLHVERVHAVREEISRRFPILDLYAEANRKHASRFPVLSEKTARTHWLWLGFHAAVAAIGLVLLAGG
jgi:hypothetical protein